MSRSIMDGTDKGAGQLHVKGSQDLHKGLLMRPFFISAGRIYIPIVYPAFRPSQISSMKLV